MLLLTRDALRSMSQDPEPTSQENPEESTSRSEQSEADEIAARLRAAAAVAPGLLVPGKAFADLSNSDVQWTTEQLQAALEALRLLEGRGPRS